MKIQRKHIAIFLLLALFLGALIFKYINKAPDNLKNKKPEINISASSLFKKFSNDEETANALYLDKIISVEGIISSVEEENSLINLYLETGDGFGKIVCEMDNRNSLDINNLIKGEEVKVIGLCTGFLMDVQLQRVHLIK